MHANKFEELFRQFAARWHLKPTQEDVKFYYAALGSFSVELLIDTLTTCAALRPAVMPKPFEIKRMADNIARVFAAIPAADETELEKERALYCQFHRYYPASNGRGDGYWRHHESCPKCRLYAGKKDPPCPPGTDPDYHRWSIGRDTRVPVDSGSNFDYLAACKQNVAEAIARWRFAKHVTDVEDKDSDVYRRAMCDRVSARADAEQWREYRLHYQALADSECTAAVAASRAAGERVPGEDDGEEF